MRVPALFAAALLCLPLAGASAHAQQSPAATPNPAQTLPPSATPTEPGTRNPQLTPASKAPRPEQAPDVRLDSKPHTDLDSSIDSTADVSSTPMDFGLGANKEMDLGHDIVPAAAPGMLTTSQAGNPRMVYFSLPHRSGDTITASDAATIAARQADLLRAAAFHGFDLKQSGWMYQQGVCPATEPGAGPGSGTGAGVILLHFIRHDDPDHVSAFTAVVPRTAGEPVRAITVVHRSVEERRALLSAKTGGATVNRALPAPVLYASLQPEQTWIASSACIAELGGAYPHIPNEPYLDEAILTAPPPTLGLSLNGDRRVIFSDRVSAETYVIWTEHIGHDGRMLGAEHTQVKVPARPVTNPPLPTPHIIDNIPQPPSRITPDPPSPISGAHQ